MKVWKGVEEEGVEKLYELGLQGDGDNVSNKPLRNTFLGLIVLDESAGANVKECLNMLTSREHKVTCDMTK